MVVVNDKKKAQRLKEFRSHGAHKKYFHDNIGGNFRLDAIQAAVVTAKLPYLDSWIEKRQNNAAQYHQLLADVPHITTPEQRQDRHTYNSYVIRAKHRDALREHLAKHGVQTQIYYPLPLHLQPCFSYLGYTEGDFPVSEQAAQEALALPIYPEMNLAMQEYVAETVRSFYTKASN